MAQAAVTEITTIQIEPTEEGIAIAIESEGELSIPTTVVEGNLVIAEIANVVLRLAQSGDFFASNPSAGIASVSVTRLEGNRVQIAIAGTDAPPVVDLRPGASGITAIVIPAESIAAPPPEAAIEIVVTAEEEEDYYVPDASTATRTETPILDVPVSIQVIPQEVLEDRGSTSLGEILRNASGVTPGRSSGSSRATTPVIRGFESDNLLRNGLRDNTLRLSSGISNVDRLEILKGPASVLFGPGNLGGTVNLVTEVPLGEPRYDLELAIGNNSLYRSSIDLTGPLISSSTYRLNAAYESRDSFQDFENSDFFFIAPTIQPINTDRTSLIVDFEYLNNRIRETASGLPAVSAIGAEDNALIDDIVEGGGQISPEDLDRAGTLDIRSNLGEPDISRTAIDISRISYRFEHQIDDTWKVRNEFLGSFQNTSEDSFVAGVGFVQEDGQPNFNLLNRVYIDNPSYREAFTVNTNIVGDFEILGSEQTFLFGVEWSRETEEDEIIQRLFLPFASPDSEPFEIFDPNYDRDRFFPDSDLNERLGSDSFTRQTTVGLYAQTQIEFSEQWIAVLGGRLDFADLFFEDLANRADPSPVETSETAFSPRVGIVYQPSDNVSIYANYTESFNPVVGRAESGEIFSPEQGDQVEVGVKADLFGDRLSANLAFYRLRRTNVLTQDPTNPGFQVQVGEQASDGVELDLLGELAPGWDIIASYAYTDARIEEDNEFPNGRQLLNVPEHAASLWTTYEIQEGDLAGLGFGLGVYFQDERNGDLRTPFDIPSFTRTDAAIFYRRDRFRAQLNVENLFDTRYFEGARDQFRVIPGAPFTIFGTISWEF